MSKNESRQERKKRAKESRRESRNEGSGGISKIYYYIIGFLFLVLILLLVFIFSRSGDDVNLEADNAEETAVVQNDQNQDEPANTTEPTDEEQSDETDEDSQDSTDDSEADTDEDSENTEDEDNDEDASEDDKPTEDVQPGESTVVSEDAPHDPNHAVNYNDGSADRVAIKNEIMAVTGLGNDLIEWWVGNNGPGRVEATVSNREQTEVYQVYLQYGEGSWHATSYERLSSVPNN